MDHSFITQFILCHQTKFLSLSHVFNTYTCNCTNPNPPLVDIVFLGFPFRVSVMSHIGWRGEQITIYSGGSGLLQMVSELDTGRCANLLAVPRRGVDTRRCASKDAGPQSGWIWRRSHIDWRKERVSARTLGPKGGGLWCPTLVGEENKPPFIRVWKPSPNIHVLKPWEEARKGKPKEDNIC